MIVEFNRAVVTRVFGGLDVVTLFPASGGVGRFHLPKTSQIRKVCMSVSIRPPVREDRRGV